MTFTAIFAAGALAVLVLGALRLFEIIREGLHSLDETNGDDWLP